MLASIFKTIFGERINDVSAVRHCNDPEWYDIHWGKLVTYFSDNVDFRNFIDQNLLNVPNVDMLNVLLKHNFDFANTIFIKKIKSHVMQERISLEVFQWIVDNQIIKKDDDSCSKFCNHLLREADQISFDKFKYAFEAGFPFSIEYPIVLRNINVAEQIWQYANNSRDINVRYTIGVLTREITYDFLREYLEWLKLHGTGDIILKHSWKEVSAKFGIRGLELLRENGYLVPSGFFPEGISAEVKNYLLANGFSDIEDLYQEVLVYHTKPMVNKVNDSNSVRTVKII